MSYLVWILGPNSCLTEEQYALLTAEPSLRPQEWFLKHSAWIFCVVLRSLQGLLPCVYFARPSQRVVRDSFQALSAVHSGSLETEKQPLNSFYLESYVYVIETGEVLTEMGKQKKKELQEDAPGLVGGMRSSSSVALCLECLLSPVLSSSLPLPLASSLNGTWEVTKLPSPLNKYVQKLEDVLNDDSIFAEMEWMQLGKLCIGDNPTGDRFQGVILNDLFIYFIFSSVCVHECM